jgi:hypothetical protein
MVYTSKGDAIVSVKPVTKDDAAVVPIAPLTLVFSPWFVIPAFPQKLRRINLKAQGQLMPTM